MSATQAQQQLMEAGVGVEGGGGVEMMVMDSLDPTLLQMKTEVRLLFRASLSCRFEGVTGADVVLIYKRDRVEAWTPNPWATTCFFPPLPFHDMQYSSP